MRRNNSNYCMDVARASAWMFISRCKWGFDVHVHTSWCSVRFLLGCDCWQTYSIKTLQNECFVQTVACVFSRIQKNFVVFWSIKVYAEFVYGMFIAANSTKKSGLAWIFWIVADTSLNVPTMRLRTCCTPSTRTLGFLTRVLRQHAL